MNFKAIDELKILGFSAEEAVLLAETFTPVGMYEAKTETDSGSHTGFTPVIGLKPEFKQLIQRNQAQS